MTEKEVELALARKYGPPFFAFFAQFRDATGWEGRRTADAIALGLYASRGYVLHGFEIKTDRKDWLLELKSPEKSERVGRFCDHFWIVAPAGVILPGEVPFAWGQLEVSKRGVRGVKEAPVRHPRPFSRAFVASLVQRALGGVKAGDVVPREELERVRKEAREEGRNAREGGLAETRDQLLSIRREVAAFEKAAGVSGLAYNGEDIGRRMKLLEEMGGDWPLSRANGLAEELREWAERLETEAKRVADSVDETKIKVTKPAADGRGIEGGAR